MPDTLNPTDTGTATRTDTETSIRVIGPDQLHGAAARQRFIAAMQPVIALRHANLVCTRGVRERGETVGVVTDAVSAGTLESILAGDPFLSLAAIYSILHQVAMALGAAHAAGVVHGALSTRSILITPAGDAVVVDVGLAAALAVAGARATAGDPSTLAYASPELVRGEPCTPSTDQYSLGVIAYELLAGRRPFDGPPGRLRRAHVSKRPEPLGAMQLVHPDEWSQAVMRMLEKRPSDRFWSLADAVQMITPPIGARSDGFRGTLGWLAQQQISGTAAPDVPIVETQWLVGDRHLTRRRYLATAVTGLVAIAIGGAAWSNRLPFITRAKLSTTAARIEQRLTPEATPAPITKSAGPTTVANERATPTVASAATSPESTLETTYETPPAPARAALRTAPRTPPRTPPSTIVRATPHEPPRPTPHGDTRPVTAYPATPAFTPVQPTDSTPPAVDQRVQIAEQPPAVVAAAPASPLPSDASAAASVPPPAIQPLTSFQAHAASMALVDQLRRDDLRSIDATMVASPGDAEFLGWLRGRSGDFQVGAPAAERAVSLSDGSVQVSYSFPVIWTHASGARRTRAVSVTTSVRPSPSGAKLASWQLSKRFVP
jgi:hypothetical protein